MVGSMSSRRRSTNFSALQRAENSSIKLRRHEEPAARAFQCSSASRKFLNSITVIDKRLALRISVLFSEPKIPQCRTSKNCSAPGCISVLFSEPKIPQSHHRRCASRMRPARFQCSSASRKFLNNFNAFPPRAPTHHFSALQRAENSSITNITKTPAARVAFQCSSASRKFLNARASPATWRGEEFQCSSASRKFLNVAEHRAAVVEELFQCSSASRKFLNGFAEIGA